jgi:hypothetical protein
MKKLVTMREALAEPDLFGSILAGDSWLPWRVLLIAMFGEKLTDDERAVFTELTGRVVEPLEPVEEFWAIVGRRGGKTRAMSVAGAYIACLCDWRDVLAPGEKGRVQYFAHTAKQASIAFDYTTALFTTLPLFASMLDNRNADSIQLTNNINLEVKTASWRSARGPTSIAAIFDEIAFFQSEEHSANTDEEILRAVRPSLATTGGPLLAISSPHAKRGELFKSYEQHYGDEGDPLILVAKGASRTFNPSLPERVVTRALQRDEAAAKAEYLAQFRDDLEAFVSLETVRASTVAGRALIAPSKHRMPYLAFCDPSGGSSDSFTLGIGHDGLNDKEVERDTLVLDLLAEAVPPFRPEAVVVRFANTLKDYGLSVVHGDNYAGKWVSDAFARYGIRYVRSSLTKSELLLNFLPELNSGRVRLLDNAKLASQLVGLERRVTSAGRETVDHAAGRHDDVANAAAGCLALLARQRRRLVKSTTSTVRI